MAIITTTRTDSLDDLRLNTNEVSDRVGDTTTLTTTSTDLTNAVNEHDGEIGDLSTLDTDATTLVGALNEHEADIGTVADLDTTATDLVTAINEHEDDLYTSTTGSFDGLTSKHFKGAVEEIVDELGQVTSLTTTASTAVGAINELDAELGTITSAAMGTTASTVSGAIAEISDDLYTSTTASFDGLTAKHFKGAVEEIVDELGQVTSLTTTASTAVGAINELDAEIGALSGKNSGIVATTIVGMINELDNEKVYLTNITRQDLYTDLKVTDNHKLTVTGTLDISGGSLLVGGAGGSLNIETTFIDLGSPEQDTAIDGGIRVKRGDAGGATELEDAQIYWSEGSRVWKTKVVNGAAGSETTVESEIVTFKTAANLFANNTETGITVAWDDTNNNFDISINDNGLALGTKTTGNYVATISGTANEIEVTGSGSETAAVTVGLVANPVVSGMTAGNITVGINNDNTIDTTTGNLTIEAAGGTVYVGNTFETGFSASIGDDLAVGRDLTVGNDVVITGDLIVNGTTTTVNTAELLISDNIFTLNSDVTGTPSQDAGFDVERGTSVNTHIHWNETSNQWEFKDETGTYNFFRQGLDTVLQFVDGDGTTITTDNNDSLQFVEGAGIDVNFTDTSEPGFGITITNTDRGSSQAIFKNVVTQNSAGTQIGSTVVADSNNDSLYLRENGGVILNTDATGDIVTIGHADTSSVGNLSSNNSGATFLQDIALTFDTYGHVTGASAGTATVQWYAKDTAGTSKTISNSAYVQTTGDGTSAAWVGGTGTSADPYNLKVTNTDKGSSQNIFKNLALTTTDSGYTWATTGTASAEANNDTFTFVSSTEIDLHVDTAGTNQGLRIKHSDVSRTNTTDTSSNGVAITGVTTNARGHVTGVNSYDFDNRFVNKTGDTMSGLLHISGEGDELLRLSDTTAAGDTSQNPYITFYQGTTRRAYIQYVGSGNYLQIVNDETDEAIRVKSGVSGLTWVAEGSEYTVYHSGNLTVPTATSSVLGLVKLEDDTVQTVAANAVTATASRTYGVQFNSSNQLVVNVPWTNTTYSAGTGLDISGTTFSVESDLRGEVNGIGDSTNNSIWTNDGTNSVLIVAGGNDNYVAYADSAYFFQPVTVQSNLSVTGTFYETSDERVKENVVTIDSALDKVSNLRGVTYNKIGEIETQIGVIAQEVEKVIPEVVKTDEDGMKSVAYANMVGLLIEAIKDLKSEIDDIKSKL